VSEVHHEIAHGLVAFVRILPQRFFHRQAQRVGNRSAQGQRFDVQDLVQQIDFRIARKWLPAAQRFVEHGAE
jgi:hypothetical protein